MQLRQEEVGKLGPHDSYDCRSDCKLWRCKDRRTLSTVAAAADQVRAFSAATGAKFLVLYIGHSYELIAIEQLDHVNLGKGAMRPMRIIRRGHELGAVGFILATLDLDWTSDMSPEELKATRECRRLGEEFGICMFHHLIVGRDRLGEVLV